MGIMSLHIKYIIFFIFKYFEKIMWNTVNALHKLFFLQNNLQSKMNFIGIVLDKNNNNILWSL